MSNIGVLAFDHVINKIIFVLFRWVTGTGLIHVVVDPCLDHSVVLLYHVRMDALAIIFVINS